MSTESGQVEKYRFAIYRIVRLDALRKRLKKLSYDKITAKAEYRTLELYVQLPPRLTIPRWLNLLKEIAEAPEDLTEVKSVSASFVITLKTRDSVYAFCGGAGAQIARHYCDEEFGIEIASRLLNEGQVRHMATSHAAGMIVHREVTSRAYLYPQLQRDTLDRIVVRLIGDLDFTEAESELGLTTAAGRAVRVFAGRSSLSLSKSLTLDELLAIIERLDEIRKLEPKIEIVRGYEEVREVDTRKKLDRVLSAELAEQYVDFVRNPSSFAEGNIGISYFDWTKHIRAHTYKLRIGKEDEAVELQEYDLWSVFLALHEKQRTRFAKSYLTNVYIESYDDQGTLLLGKPLRSLILAEVEVEGNTTFSLLYGKWYQVRPDFQQQVEEEFIRLVIESGETLRDFSLPCWPVINSDIVTEGKYIGGACSASSELHQLHQHHIHFGRGEKYELCDIYDSRASTPRLILIKRGLTVVLRELTAQAVASATFLKQVKPFITEAIHIIGEQCGAQIDESVLKSAPFVLAIVDFSLNRQEKPVQEIVKLAVKLEMIRARDEITAMGFPSVALFVVAHCPSSETAT